MSDQQHDFAVTGSAVEYDGAIVVLRVDDVTMPGGRSARREVVEHPGAVAVVALDDRQRVALIEQYRHPVGRRLWELPAGLLDSVGEAPVVAAQRELAEEVDLAAQRWEVLVDLALSPGFTDEALRVYLARELTSLPTAVRVDEEADIRFAWIPLDEAVAMALRGDIVNATAVAGILAAARVVEQGGSTRPVDVAWTDQPTAFDRRKAADSQVAQRGERD
ncbi:ADP-ribose pyrophosphatase [Gordonia araii NBRC 100433]|uniref:ADP-ribose pyrophosphatase n=1 Tax=Gordonia araii NBRC 100433 TaxID=1073574 RepID=G7GXP0_9ACTN|nr:NUDIX hydrolase [Gordonia araii]NNG99129.1 NUDIX hydrolase [Gordonia araii NBRC 100433]GAB08365.1 ADP-ribose pyrophosphatase [Gordonia araii NBRC 100433]